MKTLIIAALMFLSVRVFAADWQMVSATVTYHVVHPLHKIDATSKEARGKGSCTPKGCEFLVAAPVKSFDSGNGNRDSHTLETVNGALHPYVKLHCTSPTAASTAIFKCEIELNGKTVTAMPKINFEKLDIQGATLRGHFDLKLTDFDIKRPALFSVAVKDAFTVDFSSSWNAQ